MKRLVSLSLVALSIFLLSKPACAEIKFKQFDNTFKLTEYDPYTNVAKFTPDGWSGIEEIAQGVTRTGTISSIPTWFDFSKAFYFVYHDTSYPCE